MYLRHLILFLIPISLQAQVELRHVSSDLSIVEDVWNLEINNTDGSPKQIQIQLSLMQDGRVIYEGRSGIIPLFETIKVINAQTSGSNKPTQREAEQLDGNYTIRVLARSTEGQILFEDNLRVTAAPSPTTSEQVDNSPLSNIQFSGTGFISGQVATMQGRGSFVPRNFLRAELNPDVSVHGVPIGLDILYSTEQNALRQSMNQVALRFDAQQFKRQMEQRLRQKVNQLETFGDPSELTNLNAVKEKVLKSKFPKLTEWEAQLNDPKIQEGLKQLKQVESIDQVLNNPQVKESLKRKAELEANKKLSLEQQEELAQLKDFTKEIQKLKERAESLRALSKEYEQYKDLNKKIAEARKYENTDLLKDKAFLKDGLKSLDVMTKGQEILNGFEAITVGTSYPYYSRLSLSSLNVEGIHVEWNPGPVYVAATYGSSARLTNNTETAIPNLTLGQTTLAAKLGYGSQFDNHLHLSFVDIEDRFDERSLENPTKAQHNRIVGLDAKWSFLKDNVTVGGEIMSSLFTRDKNIETEEVQEFNEGDIPLGFVFGEINNSSSYDIAWRAFGDMRLFGGDTKLKGSIERVGANYISLGAPALLNDLLRWRGEVRQNLLDNKISLSAFARQDANNLDPLLVSTESTTTSYGLSGSVRWPKLPSVTFSYAPYSQNNNIATTEESLETDATMMNVIVGYPVQWSRDFSTFTQLTYIEQDLVSNIEGIDYDLQMYGLTQSITYKRSSVNVSINYTPNQIIGDENQEVLTLNASGSALFFGKWSNTFGVQYLNITDQENRTGFYLNSSYPILSWAELELRLQRNIYDALLDSDQNFRELVAWMGLRVRW